MKLAAQHYNNAIRRKCWKKWHMVIVEKWRRRVEKACQAKAQEICISLTSDYESKLQSVSCYIMLISNIVIYIIYLFMV